jgi:hypothetical protein
VDRRGYNAIDYTVLHFEPTDDGYRDGSDLDYFRHFRFRREPWHFLRINTWKRLGRSVNLVDSGGHEAQFEGCRVFPYKFLIKHYRTRTQRQGVKKVFLERKARWDQAERGRGWHVHYDEIVEDESFIQDPEGLFRFDSRVFDRDFLVERLSGIGLPRSVALPSRTILEVYEKANSRPTEPRSEFLQEPGEKISSSPNPEDREDAPNYALSYATTLGDMDAQLADLKLRVQESLEREQRLIDRAFEAEERLADELSTEHELRTQIARYAGFYNALQRSKPWKVIQFFRRLLGREW